MWAFRSLAEAASHEHNWFATLTYSPEFIPPRGALCHRDWQLFAKRVRRRLGPFRYLMCGEYGEQTQRPHYHALLFGLDVPDASAFSVRRGHSVFRSRILQDLWAKGIVELGTVTPQSARYCSGYVLKDTGCPEVIDDYTGEVITLPKPYGRMSLKPGIGDAWIRKYFPEVLTHGACYAQDRRFAIPRRFRDILSDLDPAAFEDLSARSIAKALASPDNSEQRLAVREQIAHATRSRYKEVRDNAL